MRVIILSIRQKLFFDHSITWLMFVDHSCGPGTVLVVGTTKRNLIQSMPSKIRFSTAKAGGREVSDYYRDTTEAAVGGGGFLQGFQAELGIS